MDFVETLSQLHALIGKTAGVSAMGRGEGGFVTFIVGTLDRGVDPVTVLDDWRGSDVVAFAFRELPSAGFVLDRKAFISSGWDDSFGQRKLRIQLEGLDLVVEGFGVAPDPGVN